jgi:asparagine synthase (glutamine-hydrolysing)
MCGICGHLHHDRSRTVEPALVHRMAAMLRQRGPDDEGYYIHGRVGLGMRRLAVIDPAGGAQPIANEDRSVFVVCNGEIYNFRDLRRELTGLGHRFATRGDVEAIVHAYEQWGDEALTRLNGMFAFALWDARRERLLLARDRMGEKPLYWHDSHDGLIWASEAKALLIAPWVDRRVNPRALHHYLSLQYTPNPLTIFESISQLPPAHKLVVERGRDAVVSRWWQLQFTPKIEISEREAVDQARARLAAAVKRQLVSDVPLGAFLSGGLDSSIIVALMAENVSTPVKTFSITFDEAHYSEAPYAREVAQRFNTEHHEIPFRPASLVRTIEEVISATDEPLADPAALPVYELARVARQDVTVALTGDGGDETLAGYQRYAVGALLGRWMALPTWITDGIVGHLARLIPESGSTPEDRSVLTGIKRLGQASRSNPKASILGWGSYFSHEDKLSLYADRWRDELATVRTDEWIAAAYDAAAACTPLDRTLAADHVTYLAGDLLPKTDRTTMAHSLEARAPFLDVEWVEWTARLPDRARIRGMSTKWLLRQASQDLLPVTIQRRAKQGFSLPIGPWLRTDLRAWARERLVDNRSLDEWFRPQAVRRLLDEHDSGRFNHGKRLWALLMFAVWLNRYANP